MKTELNLNSCNHLARLAWQNGDQALQRGWWAYVKAEAEAAGLLPAVLTEIERLKSGAPRKGARNEQ
ncbi:hypothetical protein WAE61_01950 [Comamonadaceae bacterium PP-2]